MSGTTPLTPEQLEALGPWTHSPWPEHGSDGPVRSMPYRAEPYVRAVLPTAIGPVTVDGKVRRYDDRTLILHREHIAEPVLNLWVPIALTRPIEREEASWVDVYDLGD
ncbi:hypothetical protein AUQ48_17265 [Kocuria flava]|uniref:Uncharacterized protein n=1 Tax=Kocuria flava TaxID=446860 RepID=A0A2N4SXE4_9MICC|nr:hypothetical protein [Kocuria flava]PLC10650.1 hypothetical protein AUQ48_17265 [Kocuria flava]